MTWATSRFVPGLGVATVGRATVALVLSDDTALLATLWAHVSVETALDEILDGLSAYGLRKLPSLAIARIEGDGIVRVVVRGSAVAKLSTSDGPRQIAAGKARTWIEEVVENTELIELSFDDLPVDVDDGRKPVFQVLAGMVPASSVSRPLTPEDPDFAPVEADRSLSTVAPSFEGAARVMTEDPPASISESPLAMATDSASFANQARPAVEPTVMPSDADLPAEPQSEQAPAIDLIETPPVPASDEGDYDFLFDRTVARSVQDAVVAARHPDPEPQSDELGLPRAPAGPSVVLPRRSVTIDEIPKAGLPVVDEVASTHGATISREDLRRLSEPEPAWRHDDGAGDHDGHTISKSDLLKLRGAQRPSVQGPSVHAAHCLNGHPNPPSATACRACSAQLSPAPPSEIGRPVLGALLFTNGPTIQLDRPQLIGRNPRIEGNIGSEIPNLIALDVGTGLSRLHAAIRIDGWNVFIEDLNSSNGTLVTQAGRPSQNLRGGAPLLLESGAVVDLGGVAGFTFEVGP